MRRSIINHKLNIEYKGIYKNENQLKQREIDAEREHPFRETDRIGVMFIRGFIISLPFLVCIFSFSIAAMVRKFNISGRNILYLALSLLAASCISVLLSFIHEFIHALFFPKQARKEIYRTKDMTALFVYCTAEISKTRFIIISLAPEILLGVVPVLIGLLLNRYLSCFIFLVWMTCALSAILMGIGDNYNVCNAVKQVPAGSVIFNNGIHTCWREKQTVKGKH